MLSKQYIAGFFDGEGCVRIDRIRIKSSETRPSAYTRYQLKVSIAQANPCVLEEIQKQFGGSISRDEIAKAIRPNSRARNQWCAWSGYAYEFLKAIRPHLIIKAEEADIAIQFYEEMKSLDFHWRTHRGNPPDKAKILAKRDAQYDQLCALKRRVYK